MTTHTYRVQLHAVLAPKGDSGSELISPEQVIKVRGIAAQITCYGNDYLQIKDGAGTVVFLADATDVKYCVIEPLNGDVKVLKQADDKI